MPEITLAPTLKQYQAFQILDDKETEYFLFGGGAGGGKSWLGCEWLITMCLRYPGTRWFIGRKELVQLRESTLVTFYKVCSHHALKASVHFNYNAQTSNITFLENGSNIRLMALSYEPSDHLFERFGSLEYTGGWIEEAGEIHPNAYDALKSRIGRCNNDKYGILAKILITANPKKNWLYTTFYKPQKDGTLQPQYKFLKSLVTDNPRIDKQYIEKLHELKDKALKARLLHGEWEYDDDPAALIEYDAITDMFTNDHVPGGKGYITADIARFGKDWTVIRVWDGWRVTERVPMHKSSVTEAASTIKQLANKHKIQMSSVIVDEDGVGGGVKDILKCKGFVNNSKALNDENYANLKAQCAYSFAEKVNKREVFEPGRTPVEQEIITQELEQVKQKDMENDEKKKAIISREEIIKNIGRSPDEMSSLIMRSWFDLTPKVSISW